jgi:hypothetical protein
VATADDDTTIDHSTAAHIVTKLDYDGSAANGHTNIAGRLVVATSLYSVSGVSVQYANISIFKKVSAYA